jgi:hypothetical protein
VENGSNGGGEEKEVGVSHYGAKEKRDTSSWILVEVSRGDPHWGNNVTHGGKDTIHRAMVLTGAMDVVRG